MNARRRYLWVSVIASVCFAVTSAQAWGALIATPDYSDSLTLSANGGILGRVANAYPVNLPGINVEDNHGNPVQVWTNAQWSISDDANAIPGGTPYPGGSGRGSATGMTQTGGGGTDWGIEYGLRNDFVVQTDFVQTADRIDITFGAARDNIFAPGNFSVFFRAPGTPYGQIGVFNPAVGERNTGLTSGITAPVQWHNYAVHVNVPDRTLEVFVDEVSRGVIDLDLVAGGAFAALPLSNAAVSVGYAGGDRGWSDNFVVGSPASAIALHGVPVGSSTLIGTLHYSDTFAGTAQGGKPGRFADGTYPVNSPGINVENDYGNPARAWTNGAWSIAADGTVNPGGTGYLAGSGGGSDTGMTQRGGGGDWGIEYGRAHDFVVQTDFVQVTDRVDVIAGAARDTIGDAGNLSIFFRAPGNPASPEIGIYNPAIGERDTGLTSGIASPNVWHNYAVRFDQVHRQLEVFVDQVSRGTIDLDTVAGGAFSGLALSNRAVSVGYAGGDRGWSDNFQVGVPAGFVQETLPPFLNDYQDTFTLEMYGGMAGRNRSNGNVYNSPDSAYAVEQTYGSPPATWTPRTNFSFEDTATAPAFGYPAGAGGNAGAATGLAQSGGGDFSFAYGLRSDYIVSLDAILPAGDRLDVSSLPAPGATIFSADSLSVFFRRDSVTGLPAIGLFNGATETGVLGPGTLGIGDTDWHNFAVWFNQDQDTLKLFVDRNLVADLDLTTFAGGIYQDYSNAAVGAGGSGVFWVDNFQVGAVPEPGTFALAAIGLAALAGLAWRRRAKWLKGK